MNYLEIVLEGYFNENNMKYLNNYFFREFKKAKNELLFEANEFFNGCLNVIDGWEKYFYDKNFERSRELCLMLEGAENGALIFGNLQGESIKQQRQETIEYCI